MYSGEYDACDVTLSVYPHQASLKNMPDLTLSVYPHRASLKNMPDTEGIEPTTFGILAHTSTTRTSTSTYSNRPDRVAQLIEHWASIPKVVGSIPTVVRHIF